MSTARVKRVSVMPFFAFLSLVVIHSLWRFASTGFSSTWAGPIVVAGGFLAFVGWMVRGGSTQTSAALQIALAASAAGVAISLVSTALDGAQGPLPLVYALLGFGGQLLYVFWYSRLGRTPSAALRVGGILPEFELEDEAGRTLSSVMFRGSPAVFLFYRGNWCPICVTQIRELAEQYKDLEARGAKIALVSPQPHERTRALAARFDIPLRFLVDPGGRAAGQLGILHEAGVPLGIVGYGHDTVFPTAIVTDADGRILLADQTDNYRVRPDPATFVKVLDQYRV